MPYIEIEVDEKGFYSLKNDADKGVELREKYNTAFPFPHIVIDDFMPVAALEPCIEYFPKEDDPDSKSFDREQERFKTGFNPDYLGSEIRSLFQCLNSRAFLTFLENLTGIKGLVPDPYFLGGGFHKIKTGGHLSVHADFNHHEKLNLERRINVLIYLNKDWKDEYGGQIELWDRQMKECVVSKVPEFNRCVIFNTSSDSYHGNPQPVNHPDDIPRRSIALYYYTATWDGTRRDHTTQFKVRPQSGDKTDWKILKQELMSDFLPPIIVRNYRRVKRKLGF